MMMSEGNRTQRGYVLRVNNNRRGTVRLGHRDQVVLHDEAEALGVAIDGRHLRIGGRALKTRDERLRRLHRSGDHGLRALLLLTLVGQGAKKLATPASRVHQPRKLGVAGQAAIRDFFEGYLESFGAIEIEKHAVEEMRGGGKQSAREESCSHDGPKRIWEDGH